jgi:hypothetical protein
MIFCFCLTESATLSTRHVGRHIGRYRSPHAGERAPVGALPTSAIAMAILPLSPGRMATGQARHRSAPT